MPEVENLAVLQEFMELVLLAQIAALGPKKAKRFLEELERRASLQERLTSAAPLRSSPPAAIRRTAKREAAALALAVLPMLASVAA